MGSKWQQKEREREMKTVSVAYQLSPRCGRELLMG
jgi:hypothetical protein